MTNSDSQSGNDAKTQDTLPDLYRLLGLTPLESNAPAIERALLAMQKKGEAIHASDPKLAQRVAKVVTLGQRNLLEPNRKSAYDRAWMKAFGANPEVPIRTPRPTPAPATTPSASASVSTPESSPVAAPTAVAAPTTASTTRQAPAAAIATAPALDWDVSELEAYLPAEDPRSPFDLGKFLRHSANLPESSASADYDKLQSFLGGATTVLVAPESISVATLLPEYSPALRVPSKSPEALGSLAEFTPPQLGRSVPRLPPAGIAKQIRRQRSRSMLLSIGGLVAVLAVAFSVLFYVVNLPSKTLVEAAPLAHSLPKLKPQPQVTRETQPPAGLSVPQGSGLPRVSGLDGFNAATSPDMLAGNAAAAMDPAMNSNIMAATEAAPPVPESASPPATALPTTPPPSIPAPTTPEPAAAPVLTDAEKSQWQKSMKELLKTLGAQDFAKAKEQLAATEKEARSELQKQQLRRLTTIARLAEEFQGFLVAGIAGLDAAETFIIGKSTRVAFIEGSATAITVKMSGPPQTLRLTELPTGLAMGLVDLQMDTVHPTSLARKAAFALVHPRTNPLAIKQARDQMTQAAAAGAVEADLPTVFDEDYSLKEPSAAKR